MKQYDTQTLDKLHRFGVAMLSDFIRVCEKHKIDYFAVFGTALGAARHNGYIPWDDDLDVGMLREDYERFLKIMPQELGDKYRILDTGVDKNYTCAVIHFDRKGTVFISENSKHMKCDQNIGFDIFVYDPVPDDPKLRKRQIRAGWFWGKMLYLRGTPHPVIPLKGLKKKLALAVCYVVHYSMVLFRISSRFLYRKMEINARKYSGQNTENIACFQGSDIYSTVFPKRDLYPFRTLPFETIEIKAPNQIEEYLNRIYGDYMQLPPVEDRKNHYPYRIDFGDEFDVENN